MLGCLGMGQFGGQYQLGLCTDLLFYLNSNMAGEEAKKDHVPKA